MKKKEIIGGMVVLCVIASLSGYLLAQVYQVTKPKIDYQKKIEEEKLNKEIFPEGVKFEQKEKNGVKYLDVYDKDGKEIGKIFEVKSMGYGGYIYLKVGIDSEMKIKDIKVIQHNETPGLGAKITQKSFLDQFKGKTKEKIASKSEGGEIDTITGATISSKAVINGIRNLMEKINEENN